MTSTQKLPPSCNAETTIQVLCHQHQAMIWFMPTVRTVVAHVWELLLQQLLQYMLLEDIHAHGSNKWLAVGLLFSVSCKIHTMLMGVSLRRNQHYYYYYNVAAAWVGTNCDIISLLTVAVLHILMWQAFAVLEPKLSLMLRIHAQ